MSCDSRKCLRPEIKKDTGWAESEEGEQVAQGCSYTEIYKYVVCRKFDDSLLCVIAIYLLLALVDFCWSGCAFQAQTTIFHSVDFFFDREVMSYNNRVQKRG